MAKMKMTVRCHGRSGVVQIHERVAGHKRLVAELHVRHATGAKTWNKLRELPQSVVTRAERVANRCGRRK